MQIAGEKQASLEEDDEISTINATDLNSVVKSKNCYFLKIE